jgi:hypothetical protein
MKKLVFLAVFTAFTVGTLSVQSTIYEKPVKKVQPSKTYSTTTLTPGPAPAPAPASTTTSKTTDTTTKTDVPAGVYTLTSVRVNIRTGGDNKEFPSGVLITTKAKDVPTSDWSPFSQVNLTNEMRINSDTEVGLQRDSQLRGEANLEAFQRSGIKLTITYLPNFFADAWKIEKVSLVLEFKDQFGNPHPTFGSKTIVFNNAYGFLNNDYRYLDCVTDGSFAPLTAVIRK